MLLLSWFDIRTLLCCQCMLAVMYAAVFLWMSRAHTGLKGVKEIAVGFLAGIPCTLLLVSRGHISFFMSVVVGNLLGLLVGVLLYDGVMRLIGAPRRIWLVGSVAAVSLLIVWYYSQVRLNIVPRFVAMGLNGAVVRALTAWELFRNSAGGVGRRKKPIQMRARLTRGGREDRRLERDAAGFPNRGVMRFFGLVLLLLAMVDVEQVVGIVLHGAGEDFMERSTAQIGAMAANLIYAGIYGLCFLIMASNQLISHSQEESERDALTGSLNRRGIEARLDVELKRASRYGHSLCVALIDIDHFKEINDSWGHAAGDAAIRGVAEAVQRRLRSSDLLGRYGGDEFLLVLPHTSSGQAGVLWERLRESVGDFASEGLESGVGSISLSIGIADSHAADDLLALVGRADGALYQAKSDGRACWRVAGIVPAREPVDEGFSREAKTAPVRQVSAAS